MSRAYGDTNPATATATAVNLVNGDTLRNRSARVRSHRPQQCRHLSDDGQQRALRTRCSQQLHASATPAIPRDSWSRHARSPLTPDAATRVYGDPNPASGTATVTAGNLVGADAIATAALSTPATAGSFVGTYSLSGTGAVFGNGDVGNYTITYATRANGLAVTQRRVSLTLGGNVSRPYGGGVNTQAMSAPLRPAPAAWSRVTSFLPMLSTPAVRR